MTPEQLAAIKARADKATAGPWVFGPFGGGVMLYRAAGTRPIVLDAVREGTQWATFRLRDHDRCVMVKCDRNGPTYQIEHPDAEFIAQARTDVPALVAEVERLQRIEAERVVSVAEDVANLRRRLAAAEESERNAIAMMGRFGGFGARYRSDHRRENGSICQMWPGGDKRCDICRDYDAALRAAGSGE